jgi:hypothetical protein
MFDLCIHGHVHASFDYTIGNTSVVANPLGYCSGIKKALHVGELKRKTKNSPQASLSRSNLCKLFENPLHQHGRNGDVPASSLPLNSNIQ